MRAQVDVLAVLDRQLRDRAERANRYRKNAEKSARKSGEPQITADRMAAYTDLQLVELREARAAVAALIAERDALLEALEKLVEAADTSDECRYGTLATGFVRDMASAARARAQGVES